MPVPSGELRFTDTELIRLIVPIVIEQMLALLVGLADTLMISYAGEAAVSAVSLVNQLNNVFVMSSTALAAGGSVVASQYVGRGDRESGCLAAGQLVMITTAVACVMTGILLAWGRGIFRLVFGAVEDEVYRGGMTYLKICAYSFPFLAIYNGCAGLLRSMGDTRSAMRVSLVMNAVNAVGNAIGVFYLKAGTAGVAWPTSISRVVGAAVMIVLCLDRKRTLYLRKKDVLTWKGAMLRRIFGIAVPNGLENGLMQLSKVALSSVVALFGTVQIAANGVAQSFWGMSALSSIAMMPAFVTVIGQYMGAGDIKGAEYYMHKLYRMTVSFGAAWNALFFALTPLILKVFDLSKEADRLVILLVLIHNSFNALVAPMAFAVSSGMRAAGDVKYTTAAAIFATVVCRVALAYLLGVALEMGVIGIGLAMVFDWTIHAVFIRARWKNGKWKNFRVI